jgi:glycosyltransferase involved in cell wall biosynthesis
MKKLSILYVLGNTQYGGDVLYVSMLARALLNEGHKVDVLTQDPVNVQQLQTVKGIMIINHTAINRNINPFQDLLAIYQLYKLLKSKRYSIVHTNTSKGGAVGRISACLARSSLIIHTIHGFAFHEYSSLLEKTVFGLVEAFLSRISDYLIFVNSEDRTMAITHNICKPQNSVTIYNVSQFSGHSKSKVTRPTYPQAIIPTIGFDSSKRVFLSLARLSQQKNPLTILRAIRHLRDTIRYGEFQSLSFVFAGDGPLYKDMLSFAEQYQLLENVGFLGHVKDVSSLLLSCDYLVSSSLYEGLPMTILEALSRGIFVLASNCKGNRECFPESYRFYFHPLDHVALADHIITILDDPALVNHTVAECTNYYNSHFPPNSMQEKTLELYHRLSHKVH